MIKSQEAVCEGKPFALNGNQPVGFVLATETFETICRFFPLL